VGSDKFKVGEVAIGQKFVFYTSLNGAECTIVRGQEWTDTLGPSGHVRMYAYLVLWQGCTEPSAVSEKNLKKKDGPPTDLWEKIEELTGWNPIKELETTDEPK